MTSHRVVGMSAPMKAGFLTQIDVGAGVGAGLLAIVLAFWNLHIVLLLILVVGGGGVDLLVGARRAHYNARAGIESFSDQVLSDGMWGKAVILIVILFLGVAADSMLIFVSGAAQLGFVTMFQNITPVTSALLLYRLTKESASIKRNIKQTPGGKDAIWPGLDLILDELRYRMMHPDADSMPRQRVRDQLRRIPTSAELSQLAAEAAICEEALAEIRRKKGETV